MSAAERERKLTDLEVGGAAALVEKARNNGTSSRKIGVLSPRQRKAYGITFAVLVLALLCTVVAHLIRRDQIKEMEETDENLAQLEAMLTYFWIGYAAEILLLISLAVDALTWKVVFSCNNLLGEPSKPQRATTGQEMVVDNGAAARAARRAQMQEEKNNRVASLRVGRGRHHTRRGHAFGPEVPGGGSRGDGYEDLPGGDIGGVIPPRGVGRSRAYRRKPAGRPGSLLMQSLARGGDGSADDDFAVPLSSEEDGSECSQPPPPPTP